MREKYYKVYIKFPQKIKHKRVFLDNKNKIVFINLNCKSKESNIKIYTTYPHFAKTFLENP